MARPTPSKHDKKDRKTLVSGEGIVLPPRPPSGFAPVEGVGVSHTRRQPGQNERMLRPRKAGAESKVFPAGGEAFERWLAKEKGMATNVRLPVSEYQALLDEFANRPLYGLRRGKSGGNHRANSARIRR